MNKQPEWYTRRSDYGSTTMWYGDADNPQESYCISHRTDGLYLVFFYNTGALYMYEDDREDWMLRLGDFTSLEDAKHFVEMHYAVGAFQ